LNYEQIINVINNSSKIAVTSHVQPDGDNIGSSLALCLALQKLGKKAIYVLDDNIPELYRFLKGAREVEKPSFFTELDFDLVIALDCGDLERLGKVAQQIGETKLVNIDHHVSNTRFAEINLVEENASATAEIVYKLIKSMGIFIDKDIADCIYTGIVTDTGMFQYSNTSEETHSIAAELIIAGVNPSYMFNKIYQNSPKEKVLLLGEALKSLEFFNHDMVSCISITKAQVDSIAEEDIDTEGIVNLGRDIVGVEVAIFLKQKDPNLFKVSLRSKSYIDVSIIAKDFGGGGHIRAAGCTITGSLESAKQQILLAIQKQI
jgi:bifunctional oligoribonuclease and PAP phosphatase NrnA